MTDTLTNPAFRDMFEGLKQTADALIAANEGIKRVAEAALRANTKQEETFERQWSGWKPSSWIRGVSSPITVARFARSATS